MYIIIPRAVQQTVSLVCLCYGAYGGSLFLFVLLLAWRGLSNKLATLAVLACNATDLMTKRVWWCCWSVNAQDHVTFKDSDCEIEDSGVVSVQFSCSLPCWKEAEYKLNEFALLCSQAQTFRIDSSIRGVYNPWRKQYNNPSWPFTSSLSWSVSLAFSLI